MAFSWIPLLWIPLLVLLDLDPARKKPLAAPVQNGVAPVQTRFLVVQKTLGRPLLPGSKRPFAPSPNHFWRFSLNWQFPRSVAPQPKFFCPMFFAPPWIIMDVAAFGSRMSAPRCVFFPRFEGLPEFVDPGRPPE